MKVKALAKVVGAKLWENRSNIEFVAGNIMVVAGTTMVISKAEEVTKVKHAYEAAKKRIELKDEHDDWDSDKQRSKECFKAGTDAAKGYAKALAPGLGVEVGGLIFIGMSKATDRKEIAVTSAALASTAMEFANYRKKNQELIGEAKEEELYLSSVKESVNEDGTNAIDEDSLPSHAIAFTRENPYWSDDQGMNLDSVENIQIFLNMRLQKEGVLYENDIRRALKCKIDPKAEGWGITAVDDNGNVNYIDLGINRDTGRAAAFRDGTPTEMIFVLNNMEPKINSKLYRLFKYHNDWDCELKG